MQTSQKKADETKDLHWSEVIFIVLPYDFLIELWLLILCNFITKSQLKPWFCMYWLTLRI